MKLTYNPTRKVNTADLGIACDPPMTFEVRTTIARTDKPMMAEWQRNGSVDAGQACEIIGKMFLSVQQNGESYPLDTRSAAEALRQAIEESAPGQGDTFVCVLADGFIQDHYGFFIKE